MAEVNLDRTIEETALVYLTAHHLTVDELRRSRLPDSSFTGLKAEIITEEGHRFNIIYYKIRGDERSYVDMTPVVEPGPSRHGYAPPRFTQGQIADITDLLTVLHLTVKIEYLTFEVPPSAAEQSGLPLEKLTFLKPIPP